MKPGVGLSDLSQTELVKSAYLNGLRSGINLAAQFGVEQAKVATDAIEAAAWAEPAQPSEDGERAAAAALAPFLDGGEQQAQAVVRVVKRYLADEAGGAS